MNIDERLRDGLEQNVASFTPDVDLALRQVLQRRRPTTPRRPLIGIAAALVGVVALGAINQLGERGSSTPPATVPPNTATAISGRQFDATVPVAVHDDVAELTGRWRMRFNADATVTINPPQRFRGTVTTPATVSGHEIITDLFSADMCSGHLPGRYHWSIAPWGDLNLAVLDDSCPARTELLVGFGRTWTASTSTPEPPIVVP
jgi:hypothetical protein